MSGLYSALSTSVSALQAQSLAVQVAGKNLANVNSTSYSRENVIYGSGATVVTPDGAESVGVTATVEQIRDALLDKQVMTESALSSYYTTIQAAYQRAQAGLGENLSATGSTSSSSSATSDTGVGAALDDFFNAFQTFAANPTDTGGRQALLASASILTGRLQQSDQSLAQAQTDLNTQIASNVSSANTLLQNIADLNSQIGRVEVNNPGSAVDLRDQREQALEQLAALMPVNAVADASGQVQVTALDSGGNPVVLVNLGTVQASVAFDGTNVTAGTPPTTLSLASGSIQGALDARNGAIQTIRGQLDNLADQLVTSVNNIYDPSGTTGDFFAASGTTAGTISLASGLTAANVKASNGGAAGDNTVALAIANLATQPFSTSGTPPDQIDGTLSSYYASSVTEFGQALNTVNSNVTNQTSIETLVRSQRDTVSGVNLDEEMANLMKYQRAFQASSRVFQTVDSLLDLVVNQLSTTTS